ncbi:MAG: VaFE repeat-containing surface-anchored protein [Clostridiales bacterium]|nr:VaFE repeat-containing surface-anchored protein [Clostridiales bacterium]
MKLKNRIIAGAIAFVVAVSPLQTTFAAFADEINNNSETQVEETQPETHQPPAETQTIQETVVETEPAVVVTEPYQEPDYSEYAEPTETDLTSETTESSVETETVETDTDTIEFSETTAETVIAEETTVSEPEVVEEVVSNIIAASSLDEYFKLVSELPESSNRLIIETTADLSELNVTSGVYYDGTYILYFDNLDDYAYSMTVLSDNGYNYTVDGTIGLCGDFDEVISNASINPNATVKVAVIDTGSNLANESYSVIGDDTSDYNGHGTAMSSFILNETDNAYIISIKAIGDDGKGNVSDVYAAVQMAEDMGVDYILMAISIRECGRYDLFKSLVENARAKVVASAGNNGTDAAYYLPANVNGVITVGAIDSNGELQSVSNYGDSVDYYVEAESTSEAASKALGIIIDNRTSELATEYIEPIVETGEIYYKVGSIDDDGNFIVNSIGDDNIPVYGGADADCMISYSDWISGASSGRTYAMRDDDYNSAEFGCFSDSVYCIQPFKETPQAASSYGRDDNNWDASNNTLFQAALACAPGGDLYQLEIDWWRNNGQSVLNYSIPDSFSANNVNGGNTSVSDPNRAMYAIAHMAASYAYYGEDFEPNEGSLGIPDGSFRTVFLNYIEYLRTVRADSDYKNWWAEVYENNGNTATYQTIARGGATYAPKNVTVVKTSTNTAIVSNNACYSMAGTTYGLYKTDGTLVHTFTLDASGRTTAYTLQQADGKDLYVQEISAGPGYKLNSAKYTVDFTTADSNDLITIAVQDTPMSDPISWTLEKEDHNGWFTVTDKTLAGAVFRVEYYDRTDIRTEADISKLDSATPKVTLTLTSSLVKVRRGLITINQSTLAAADSTGYFSSFNSLRELPLGTYKITEISAPAGYTVVSASKPIVWYVYDNNGTNGSDFIADNTIYNSASASEIVMQETPQVGFYAPTKVVASGSPVITGLHSLNGTKYGIYYKANDNLVCTVTFNASGAVSDVVYAAGITPIHPWTAGNANIELAVGDYYAKEITAGRWFKLDTSTHDFSVTANVTTTADLTDESKQPPKLHTTATDADTGTHQLSYKERVTITDEVAYEGLVVGESYTTEAFIYDVSTGKPYEDADGKTYSQKVVITPTAENGKATVTFKDVLVPMTATKLVIFEYLYENQNNVLIATHADLTDEGQTVERKEVDVKTTATDADNGTHTLTYKERVNINDKATYTNLNPGETYYFTGTLIDTTTGQPYKDSEGKTYTKTVEFTATTADGYEIIAFTDVLVPFTKTTIVVFEDLYEKTTGNHLATHADLTDKDQTVKRPTAATTATVLNAKEVWLGSSEVTTITISDVIAFTGFEIGGTYRAEATAFKSDGTQITVAGQPVTSIAVFNPTTEDGTVTVDITISTEGLAEGDKIVIFEKIYDIATDEEIKNGIQTGDLLIARHEDLTDTDQTITLHYRPMTGSVTPSYTVAGCMIATISAIAMGAWLVIARRKRIGEA